MINKSKRLFGFILCLIVILSFNTTVFATQEDETVIKREIQKYFDNQFKNKQDLKIVEPVLKSSELTAENKHFFDIEQAALLIEFDFLANQKEDLRFSSYKYDLNYIDINFYQNTAEVKLTEDHEIQFNYLDTPSYLKGKEHVFKLIKRGNKWNITEHNDGSVLKNNIIKELHAGKRIEEITKEKIQKNRHDLEILSKSNERDVVLNELDNTNSNSVVTPLAYTANNLNRAAAIKYARDYALKNNPSPWGTYSNGDCTNFVSIALYKGGVPKDDVGTNTWYWNDSTDKTASWTAARYLRPYLLNNKGSSSTFGVKAVSIDYKQSENADVISFHNGTQIGHSAIVTSYKTDDMGHHYGQTICQHSYGSAAAKDYPLSSMVVDYGSSNVYAAWITFIYK